MNKNQLFFVTDCSANEAPPEQSFNMRSSSCMLLIFVVIAACCAATSAAPEPILPRSAPMGFKSLNETMLPRGCVIGGGRCTYVQNFAIYGDYLGIKRGDGAVYVDSSLSCCAKCKSNSRCYSFSYNKAGKYCWLSAYRGSTSSSFGFKSSQWTTGWVSC